MLCAGRLHCPRCFCMRDFVPTPEAAENDPYPPIECVVCWYEFHKHGVEDPETGHVTQVETLSREVRDQAREDYILDFVKSVRENGYNLRPEHRQYLRRRNG